MALNSELGAYFASPAEARALSENFDRNVIQLAYRVGLDEGGHLTWTSVQDGEEITLTSEPNTTWWERFSIGFLSIIVPESQL